MRVRFAPSPTGALHIGGARTALYNWLLARGHGARVRPAHRGHRPRALHPRERRADLRGAALAGASTGTATRSSSPSARDRHAEVVEQLIAGGHAYRSTAGPDAGQGVQGGPRQRAASAARTRARAPCGCGCPTRARPSCATSSAARAPSSTALMDDLVIARADGTPVYHLAVVVDDLDAGITHVVRGADHFSNTPKQMRILEAMGAERPGLRPRAAAARPRRQEALQAPRRGVRAGAARRAATCPRPSATTSRCSAGATTRRRPSTPRRSCSSASRSSASPARPPCSTSRSCDG